MRTGQRAAMGEPSGAADPSGDAPAAADGDADGADREDAVRGAAAAEGISDYEVEVLERAPTMTEKAVAMKTGPRNTADLPADGVVDVEMDEFHSADDGESDAEAAMLEEPRAEERAQFEAILAQEPEQF
eukprot:14405218-Alexandrium_andersonii.AAC.1